MNITATWHRFDSSESSIEIDRDDDSIFDGVTECNLCIAVDDRVLTRVVDENKIRHEGPRVSAFRFAEWLLWNWWRIRWEPSSGSRRHTLSWRQAHETTSIGGGWLWPTLKFESDGRTISIRSLKKPATTIEPVHYEGVEPEHVVATEHFERAIDMFIEQVIVRLKNHNLSENPLVNMWHELQDERNGHRQTTYRRIEALLGKNPEEGSERVINQLINDMAYIGEGATNEIAANEPSESDQIVFANDLVNLANSTGFEFQELDSSLFKPKLKDSIVHSYDEDIVSTPPWLIGENAAKTLRHQENLGERAITNRLLCDMCGLPDGAFNKPLNERSPIAFTLSSKDGKQIVFRAAGPEGRRFEAARLLGDSLLVRNNEALQPATFSDMFRQKAQRSFAAELLCPFDLLVSTLGDDQTDMSIEKVARAYRVSPLLVTTSLNNHGVLDPNQKTYAPAA